MKIKHKFKYKYIWFWPGLAEIQGRFGCEGWYDWHPFCLHYTGIDYNYDDNYDDDYDDDDDDGDG